MDGERWAGTVYIVRGILCRGLSPSFILTRRLRQAFVFVSLLICVLKCWGKTQILINDLPFDYKIDSVSMHIDNNSALKLIRNPEGHQRTKYVNARHYFIRDAPTLWLFIRLLL
jgi:hypothetical protein